MVPQGSPGNRAGRASATSHRSYWKSKNPLRQSPVGEYFLKIEQLWNLCNLALRPVRRPRLPSRLALLRRALLRSLELRGRRCTSRSGDFFFGLSGDLLASLSGCVVLAEDARERGALCTEVTGRPRSGAATGLDRKHRTRCRSSDKTRLLRPKKGPRGGPTRDQGKGPTGAQVNGPASAQ